MLQQQQGPGKATFSVRFGFEPLPEELKQIYLSVFLQLDAEKDFIPLFEHAKLEIKQKTKT
ncbi:hypothetical protein [Rheinheimera sp.]|uniref:hypothetical protein n=1 Tax=Rheinheimera sp. TaxID=1869214 RepID=UPI00307F5928